MKHCAERQASTAIIAGVISSERLSGSLIRVPSAAPAVGYWLEFYVRVTPKAKSEWAPNCESAQSWQLLNATQLRDQVTSTMT